MTFLRYQHLERIDTEAVENITIGKCYIFPKLDGSNGSIWFDQRVRCGSRNRELDTVNPGNCDNAGFCQWVSKQEKFQQFFSKYPHLHLYGEWLVPHSLLTYQENAWRNFYVFDVFDTEKQQFLNYLSYSPLMEQFDIDYVPCMCIIENPNQEQLVHEVQKNVFLIQEGKGYGEGIVIKNYEYTNKFGNVVWAKMIANTFKEQHLKQWQPTLISSDHIEAAIVDKFVSKHLVDKVVAKIKNEKGGWESKYIPMLLGLVWHDLITEELWNILKEFKNPRVDFNFLQKLTIIKIKQLCQELF